MRSLDQSDGPPSHHPSARGTLLAGTLLGGILLLTACSDDGVTGPGPEGLDSFRRAVIEEVAVDRIMDLTWVADSHGGQFPQLSFAYGLAGVGAGVLASVTVDSSFEPGLYAPYCTPTALDGIQWCARNRLREDGAWEIGVYFTVPPDSTPRQQPALAYKGEEPVGTVIHRPQPLRVWVFRATRAGEVSGVFARLDERLTVTSQAGTAAEFSVAGDLEADLEATEELRVDLSVGGLEACSELRVSLHAVHGDGVSDGEIRCGDRVWADITFAPGEPADVVWRD